MWHPKECACRVREDSLKKHSGVEVAGMWRKNIESHSLPTLNLQHYFQVTISESRTFLCLPLSLNLSYTNLIACFSIFQTQLTSYVLFTLNHQQHISPGPQVSFFFFIQKLLNGHYHVSDTDLGIKNAVVNKTHFSQHKLTFKQKDSW